LNLYSDFIVSQIAKLYYINKVKQKDIAKIYNVSPMHISRVIKYAEDRGIVKIHIVMPYELNHNLATKIMTKYNLKDCCVLVDKFNEPTEQVSDYTAAYLANMISNDSVIGLSWGYTISEIIRKMPYQKTLNVQIIQLSGGFVFDSKSTLNPSETIMEAAVKLSSKAWSLNSPFYVGSKEVRDNIVNDASNRKVFELAKTSSVNLIGVSNLDRSSTTRRLNLLAEHDYDVLTQLGAVGDIAGFFIDADGNPIKWDKSDLHISVPLDDIKQATNVICPITSKNKLEVLKAAMNKKYFNILITTENIANGLI